MHTLSMYIFGINNFFDVLFSQGGVIIYHTSLMAIRI